MEYVQVVMSKGVNPRYVQGVMRMSKEAESVSRRVYPKEYIPGKVQGVGGMSKGVGGFSKGIECQTKGV